MLKRRYPWPWLLLAIQAKLVDPLCAQPVPGVDSQIVDTRSGTIAADNKAIKFEEAVKSLGAVFPVRLDRFDQVTQNSYNWKNQQDASVTCDIGFTPEAILIQGQILDDQPFYQTMSRPAMPDWWRIRYGADGLEFIFENPLDPTRKLHLLLNLSSAGVNPQVELAAAPLAAKPGIIQGAEVQLSGLEAQPTITANAVAPTGFRFKAAIPTAGIAEPKFFSGPLRMTIRLHDVDGDFHTYLVMEDIVEKK